MFIVSDGYSALYNTRLKVNGVFFFFKALIIEADSRLPFAERLLVNWPSGIFITIL